MANDANSLASPGLSHGENEKIDPYCVPMPLSATPCMLSTNAQRILVVLAVAIAGAITTAAQTAAQVIKVDPPGWWLGHSINPVRLLIRGRNLDGVRVTASDGLRAGTTKVNAAGPYLFVDIQISPQVKPG